MNPLYNGISLTILDNLKFSFDTYPNQDNAKDVLLTLITLQVPVSFLKFTVSKSKKVVLKWEGQRFCSQEKNKIPYSIQY